MKITRTALPVVLVCLFAVASLSAVPRTISSQAASGPCVAGRTAAPVGFWTWPSNTRVNVYLRQPDFSESDVAAVRIAVENWDVAAPENGSNVRFTFRGLTKETRVANGDLTLVRGDVYSSKIRHLAMLEAHSLRDDQLIDYALVIVDRSVSRPQVLTNVIAHELGHSLGLLDCHKCDRQSTAMGMMKTATEPNGIDGPTACDTSAVRLAYRELKRHVGPAPGAIALSKAATDPGEEPEEDDTPIVPR
jgi:hypothetical protein